MNDYKNKQISRLDFLITTYDQRQKPCQVAGFNQFLTSIFSSISLLLSTG